jgi:hypothetical protein
MKRFKLIISLLVFFYSTNLFAQLGWQAQTNPVTGRDLNSAWAVDVNTCWMCGATSLQTLGYVIRTTNGGLPWTNVTGDMPVSTVGLYSICGISATEAWVGANDGSVYHTTNSGSHWSYVSLPSPVTQFIDAIHFFNQNTGFIIGDPLTTQWCYYWTTNAGVNWTSAGPSFTGAEAGWNNGYAALDTGHIWFGTNNTKIYRGGLKSGFVSISTLGLNSIGIAFMNANTGVAAMTNVSNLVLSFNVTTNGGTNWTAGYTPAGVQNGLKCVPGTPYIWSCGAGSSGGVILQSTNYGVNWTNQYTMSAAGYCLTFATTDRGWAGCSTGLIYRYAYTPDEVNNSKEIFPKDYLLEQNYPNPFNPTTCIRFNLPKESRITLKVYDLLGSKVSTIVNGVILKAGLKSYSFDGTNLSSGIYYYKIFTDEFSDSKKMILLK